MQVGYNNGLDRCDMKSNWILDILNDPSVIPEEANLECRKKTKVKDGTDMTSGFDI